MVSTAPLSPRLPLSRLRSAALPAIFRISTAPCSRTVDIRVYRMAANFGGLRGLGARCLTGCHCAAQCELVVVVLGPSLLKRGDGSLLLGAQRSPSIILYTLLQRSLSYSYHDTAMAPGRSQRHRNRTEINTVNNAELRANAQSILTFIRASRPKNTSLVYSLKQKEFKVRSRALRPS